MKNEFRYGMIARPFGLGCQPTEGIVNVENALSFSQYYNIITYNHKLTIEEVNKYELIELN